MAKAKGIDEEPTNIEGKGGPGRGLGGAVGTMLYLGSASGGKDTVPNVVKRGVADTRAGCLQMHPADEDVVDDAAETFGVVDIDSEITVPDAETVGGRSTDLGHDSQPILKEYGSCWGDDDGVGGGGEDLGSGETNLGGQQARRRVGREELVVVVTNVVVTGIDLEATVGVNLALLTSMVKGGVHEVHVEMSQSEDLVFVALGVLGNAAPHH